MACWEGAIAIYLVIILGKHVTKMKENWTKCFLFLDKGNKEVNYNLNLFNLSTKS